MTARHQHLPPHRDSEVSGVFLLQVSLSTCNLQAAVALLTNNLQTTRSEYKNPHSHNPRPTAAPVGNCNAIQLQDDLPTIATNPRLSRLFAGSLWSAESQSDVHVLRPWHSTTQHMLMEHVQNRSSGYALCNVYDGALQHTLSCLAQFVASQQKLRKSHDQAACLIFQHQARGVNDGQINQSDKPEVDAAETLCCDSVCDSACSAVSIAAC